MPETKFRANTDPQAKLQYLSFLIVRFLDFGQIMFQNVVRQTAEWQLYEEGCELFGMGIMGKMRSNTITNIQFERQS
jgi:hypothetical protein